MQGRNKRAREAGLVSGKALLQKKGVASHNGCAMGTPTITKLAIMRAHYERSLTVHERRFLSFPNG